MTTTVPPKSRGSLVARDDRPFLVQAMDSALERGLWDQFDIEAFKARAMHMGFRYLTRMQKDIRDLPAVGDAAEAVIMYVSDGLRVLAEDDLTRAVELLASNDHLLTSAFRVGWSKTLAARKSLEMVSHGDRVSVGPASKVLQLNRYPDAMLSGPVFQEETYSDRMLLEAFRDGGGIHHVRSALCRVVESLHAHRRVMDVLPFEGVDTHWDELLGAETYALHPERTLSAFVFAWCGMLIHAALSGQCCMVVPLAQFKEFHGQYLSVPMTDDEQCAFLDRMTAIVAPCVAARLGHHEDNAVRSALTYAFSELIAMEMGLITMDVRAHSDEWTLEWASMVFLSATGEVRERINTFLEPELNHEELMIRIQGSHRLDVRRAALARIDVEELPARTLIDLLSVGEPMTTEILRRAQIGKRGADELVELATADLPRSARTMLCIAIVTEATTMHELDPPEILPLLLDGIPETRECYQALLTRWRADPPTVLEAFRTEDDEEARRCWIRLAASSPEHFRYLRYDAESFPGELATIVEIFQGGGLTPFISPDFVIALFHGLERAACAQEGEESAPFARGDAHPFFVSADCVWLWEHLNPNLRLGVEQSWNVAPS